MLEVILLVVGIVYFFRRPKLKRLKPEAFTEVDPQKFEDWRKAALLATDLFLWATWGAFIVKLIVTMALSGSALARNDPFVLMGVILALWFVGLLVASVYGSKAKKLQRAAGIKWP